MKERTRRFAELLSQELEAEAWGDIDPYIIAKISEGDLTDEGVKDAEQGGNWVNSLAGCLERALDRLEAEPRPDRPS